jgi:negative regulator of replication initiation
MKSHHVQQFKVIIRSHVACHMSRVREIPNWIITATSIMGTTQLIAHLNQSVMQPTSKITCICATKLY